MEHEGNLGGSPQQAVPQGETGASAPVDPPTPSDPAPRRRLMMLLVGGGAFVVLVVVLVVLSFQSRTPAPAGTIPPQPQPTTVPSPLVSPVTDVETPDPDLPPLYPGVEWEELVAGTYLFINEADEVVEEAGYRFESVEYKDFPAGFIDYYNAELISRGWKLVGGIGDEVFYVKGKRHFKFGDLKSNQGLYQVFVEYR